MLNNRRVYIRSASEDDKNQIYNLVQFGRHVHNHLDWCHPTDLIGHNPFLVAEWNYQLLAALACPPDPEGVAWIRLFTVNSMISTNDAWKELWAEAQKQLININVMVAVIPFHKWFQELLKNDHFTHIGDVVVLQWAQEALPVAPRHLDLTIRKMTYMDVPIIHQIDQLAFDPLWQNSQTLLEIALSKSAYATIAETPKGVVVGYQISTANGSSGHLARLAVHPEWQGQGLGYALAYNVLSQFHLWGTLRMTVNTQSNNFTSLALYKKLGFRETREKYPVNQFDTSGD